VVKTDHEVSLLRLIEKVTNGTIIEISYTGESSLLNQPETMKLKIAFLGTAILLKPGVIIGGPVVHDCPLSRSLGYFLEPIIMLAPFAKRPLQLTLRGVTTDSADLSASPMVPMQIISYQCYDRWT
jgi:RNA 3'-terminal phosphate cyclase-like protein